MIAVDTSVWIDFSKGKENRQTELLQLSLLRSLVVIPYPVLYEILSWPKLDLHTAELFSRIPKADLTAGFWERAAVLRKRILQRKFKAKSIDILIAQCCLDHQIPLLTTDNDFKVIEKEGLELA